MLGIVNTPTKTLTPSDEKRIPLHKGTRCKVHGTRTRKVKLFFVELEPYALSRSPRRGHTISVSTVGYMGPLHYDREK